MLDGFIRVAAATPELKVADCQGNTRVMIEQMRQAAAKDVQLLIFPELGLTGYTCSDLFLSETLLEAARTGLQQIMSVSQDLDLICVVGLPLPYGAALYNTAAVVHRGRLLGLVPKAHIPNYSEFYEARHFSSGAEAAGTIRLFGQDVPFGHDLLFACDERPDFVLAVEICEDLWVPQSPSIRQARSGATILANLSASDELIGKADYRRLLVSSHSARLICAYVYADAGEGESTTDLVFAGHNLIFENGRQLAQSALFSYGMITAEVDVAMLAAERRRQNTFTQDETAVQRRIVFHLQPHRLALTRHYAARPFVPDRAADLAERCEQILALQMHGLKKRLAHTQARSAVIGLSGGLDSTLALLVTVRAFDALALPHEGVICVTMPGFGTTDRTYLNALALARELHTTLHEIPISEAVTIHFKDIGHDPDLHDITYENSQARERTQILMDMANQANGLVIGTGDLSELALGWATYNGDHMSMYGVNVSIPKTLVRHLVGYAAGLAAQSGGERLAAVLQDILETPVSPELLPPDQGEISQKTEHIVGPYELHDFFSVLYGPSWLHATQNPSSGPSGFCRPL